ncbi:MAG: hypothetical protein SFX72_06865 [Isosphaeraceae bacterium]|nr:hypothetical protein [Isosphaeraceae bacterium]
MSADGERSLLRRELDRRRDQLADDAPERLERLWEAETADLPFDRIAEFVEARLAVPDALPPGIKRVVHPSRRVGRSPLLAAIERYRPELRAFGVERLFSRHRIELQRLDPVALAGELARRLASDEAAPLRRTGAEIEAVEDHVEASLRRFESYLLPNTLEPLFPRVFDAIARFDRVAMRVERIHRLLADRSLSAYHRPGSPFPSTGVDSVRATLLRYPDIVVPARIAFLEGSLAARFRGASPDAAAGGTAEAIGARD